MTGTGFDALKPSLHASGPLRSHLRFRNPREFSLRRSENHAKKGLTGRPRGFGSPRSWNFRGLRREPVRWLSGRKRRFAKALYPLKGTQGSNPCLTALSSAPTNSNGVCSGCCDAWTRATFPSHPLPSSLQLAVPRYRPVHAHPGWGSLDEEFRDAGGGAPMFPLVQYQRGSTSHVFRRPRDRNEIS